MTPSLLEEKLSQQEFRQYLIEHYGALVAALGFTGPCTAEEAHLLYNAIRRPVEEIVGRSLAYDELLNAIESFSDEQKLAIREQIMKRHPSRLR